ncbi:unnamed protein product [Camellia sinensis]
MDRVVSPWKLVDNLNSISSNFRRFQQEDAHEFLQCLSDRLDSCCIYSQTKDTSLPSADESLVKQVFGGRLISKLQCYNCGHSSDTYEPLIDLSLEIENVGALPSALESFTKVEKIEDPETKFTCEQCKEKVSVEKQLILNQAPSVAAFHLKRFKNDGSYVEKIDKHVEFPLELDLLPYTGGDRNNDMELKYNLYAVVVHIEFSSTSGHYYCFIHSAPDAWYMLDDSKMDYLVHRAKLYMTDWHYKHFWKEYIFLDRCVWKRFGWTSSYIFGKTSSYIFWMNVYGKYLDRLLVCIFFYRCAWITI